VLTADVTRQIELGVKTVSGKGFRETLILYTFPQILGFQNIKNLEGGNSMV
jgi:hypothetical protein